MDLLWSDPTTNDGVQGVQPSPRGPGLVTFGPDRVKDFCKVGAVSACEAAWHAWQATVGPCLVSLCMVAARTSMDAPYCWRMQQPGVLCRRSVVRAC